MTDVLGIIQSGSDFPKLTAYGIRDTRSYEGCWHGCKTTRGSQSRRNRRRLASLLHSRDIFRLCACIYTSLSLFLVILALMTARDATGATWDMG